MSAFTGLASVFQSCQPLQQSAQAIGDGLHFGLLIFVLELSSFAAIFSLPVWAVWVVRRF